MPSKLDPHKTDIEQALRGGVSVNALAEVYRGKLGGLARSTMQDFVRKNFPPDVGAGLFADDELTQDPDESQAIPVIHRDYTEQDVLHVYPLGDIHLGSPHCATDALGEWLQYLEDTDHVSLLNTGDNLNCAIASSVSDTYGETMNVGEARALLTDLFRPLAEQGKIDGIIDGNHEDRIYRAVGDSPNAAVADALGVPYSPAALLVVYHVGDQEYTLYVRHGKGGGATMGAAVNRLERQERIIDADIYVSGHTHTQVAFPKNTFVLNPTDPSEVIRKKRLFVCSGSFVGYEDYVKVMGMPPAHIGAPRIFLDGRRHDAHASV